MLKRLGIYRTFQARPAVSILAIISSLIAAGLLLLLTGFNPIATLISLFDAAFTCRAVSQCAILTTFQFTTPLLLTGLSAVVAFRSGLFSVGQAGQMLWGAAAVAWISPQLDLSPALHTIVALAFASIAGALWGSLPGLLKVYLGINEVIVTLVLNQLALLMIGLIRLGRVSESMRMTPLVQGTKLNAGIFIAVLCAALVFVWLRRTTRGYEQRMAGQSILFAKQGGVPERWVMLRGMMISGALAGLAGAIEMLGVHYRFTSTFSGGGGFDGVAVALLGQSDPIGAVLAALLLAGVRLGAINGLQLKAHVPRELGGAIIALMILFVSIGSLYRRSLAHVRPAPLGEGE